MTITIKKEVQERYCDVELLWNDSIVIRIHADLRVFVLFFDLSGVDNIPNAKRYCEDVQLGGPVEWGISNSDSKTTSQRVYTDACGKRLTPAELELVRQEFRAGAA